jgi:6-phosphogluconate dehydrogenase (decarboxylating)
MKLERPRNYLADGCGGGDRADNLFKGHRSLGIHYLDVRTSVRIWGLEPGYCVMMIGGRIGDRATFGPYKP